MVTWGYIKEATLAKLDVDANDSLVQGFTNKFYIYANEAINMISTTVNAKKVYKDYLVRDKKLYTDWFKDYYKLDNLDFLYVNKCNYDDLTPEQKELYEEYWKHTFTDEIVKMPSDFVKFLHNSKQYVQRYEPTIPNRNQLIVDDVEEYLYQEYKKSLVTEQASREDYILYGTGSIKFLRTGNYHFVYGAAWYNFTSTTKDSDIIEAPDDILYSLPSYIASQCYKIDDEQKSAIYRNEFELMLARINENDDTEPCDIVIGGDW